VKDVRFATHQSGVQKQEHFQHEKAHDPTMRSESRIALPEFVNRFCAKEFDVFLN
jgi:hypothetical protein